MRSLEPDTIDTHHLCLPDHLSPDGLAPDERTQALIEELEGWSFWWPDSQNRVMLCREDDD